MLDNHGPAFDDLLDRAAADNPTLRWALGHGRYVTGSATSREFLARYLDYHLSVESLFADTVVMDYAAVFGGEAQTNTAAEQTRFSRDQLEPLDATMHVATTLLVELDGDSASVNADILTWLRREAAPDGPMWSNGAVGEFRLTRTASGWRITAITVRPAWTDGNMGVLEPTPLNR